MLADLNLCKLRNISIVTIFFTIVKLWIFQIFLFLENYSKSQKINFFLRTLKLELLAIFPVIFSINLGDRARAIDPSNLQFIN